MAETATAPDPAAATKTSAGLRRERDQLVAEMRGLLSAAAENGKMTDAQRARYDHLRQAQGDLKETYLRLEQQETLEAELRASQGTVAARLEQPGGLGALDLRGAGSDDGAALLAFTPAGQSILERYDRDKRIELRLQHEFGEGIWGPPQFAAASTVAYRDAFVGYIRRGADGLTAAERRTLQDGADPSGGYLVPEQALNLILSRDPAPTRVSGRVTAIPTTRDRVTAPRVNYSTDTTYTSGMRVTWTGEVPASATTHRVTDPVFGQVQIDVHTAMMSLPLTRDFVEDSAFPVVSWVTGKFAETVDLLRDNMILNGSGINQPHGILENPGVGEEPSVTNSGSAATLIPNGLQDIVWDVPEQYEDNSAWVFNKNSTGKTIAKMVDSQSRYLWQPYEQSGLTGSRRADLLGYPVVFSAFAPNVSAGTYPLVFGDLRGYYRVDRVGLSVQVLNELYAETNQVLLLGRVRLGGDVAEPYRLRIQKVSA